MGEGGKDCYHLFGGIDIFERYIVLSNHIRI